MITDQAPGTFDPIVSSGRNFLDLCHAMPVPVLVLDEQFNIVMANDHCVNLLGFGKLNEILGLGLVVSSDLQSQSGKCHRICLKGNELPLQDIQIDSQLTETDDGAHFVVALTDTSQQNRQRSMEQIFFHDILNTAGGMHGMSEVLLEAEPEEMPELQDSVHNLAAQLVEEITAQRDFVAAENGELKVNSMHVQSHPLLRNLAHTYGNHPASGQRHITVLEKHGPLQFISDPVLLNRVLGNMVKNALEASTYPEVVTLKSGLLEEAKGKPRLITFSVHNPGYIPCENQSQIFQHSFSTKGTGRGLGTFSMQMLAEKYLKGRVSFSTDPACGTTFTITLPLGGPS
jgi:signal transduction histidine kinase